jgi:hypothetical protein
MKHQSQTHISQATVSLGNEREVLDLVANSIMGLWDVVNNLTRLRPTERERYRVTIFGSGSRGSLGLCRRTRCGRGADPNGMRHHHQVAGRG